MTDDTNGLLEIINGRFDNIENLLQILLVNDLIGELEGIVKMSEDRISSGLRVLLDNYGVKYEGSKTINDVEVFVVKIPKETKLIFKDLRLIYFEIKLNYPEKEPLLMFSSINGMQRKRIIQEGISFGVHGKELHITNRGNRK